MSQESTTRRITTSRGLRWALGCTTLVVGVAVPVIYHYQAGVLDQAMIHQERRLQDAIVRVKRGMTASEAVGIVGEAPHSIATQQAIVLSDRLPYASPQGDLGDTRAPELLTFRSWEHGRVTVGVVTDSSERVVKWSQHFRQQVPKRSETLHWLEECLERGLSRLL